MEMQLTQVYLVERLKVPRVFLCGNNRAVPITWKSKKLERLKVQWHQKQ